MPIGTVIGRGGNPRPVLSVTTLITGDNVENVTLVEMIDLISLRSIEGAVERLNSRAPERCVEIVLTFEDAIALRAWLIKLKGGTQFSGDKQAQAAGYLET